MDKKHAKCWVWKTLWGFGILSFVLALAGFDSQYWMWNALVAGVLAITIKLDCQSCEVCK
jgi:hypothetical protein